MSAVDASSDPAVNGTGGSDLPVTQRTFDALVSVFSLCLVAGVALDFRSHASGISFAEEGFFTPEHVFFYSAFLGVAATLFVGTYVRRRAGRDWVDAVPPGYRLGMLGVLIFGFGGVGDFLWHSAFGFEQGFEQLVSPSHLVLGTGAVLFLASPMQSASERWTSSSSGVLASLPVVVSMTLVLTIIGLFAGFVNPLYAPYPASGSVAMQPVVAMLVAFPLLYVGAIVVVERRFGAIPGAFTVMFALSGLAIVQVGGHLWLVVPALASGVVADALVAWAVPFDERPGRFRAVAASVPLVFATMYFAVVEFQWGIAHPMLESGFEKWSVHIVGGAIVLAAIGGVLFSTVVLPARGASSSPPADGDEGS